MKSAIKKIIPGTKDDSKKDEADLVAGKTADIKPEVGNMKVVRVVEYHQNLELQEAPEPKIEGPLDVIVKIGAAGVCRTDIHILEGQWKDKSG